MVFPVYQLRRLVAQPSCKYKSAVVTQFGSCASLLRIKFRGDEDVAGSSPVSGVFPKGKFVDVG